MDPRTSEHDRSADAASPAGPAKNGWRRATHWEPRIDEPSADSSCGASREAKIASGAVTLSYLNFEALAAGIRAVSRPGKTWHIDQF